MPAYQTFTLQHPLFNRELLIAEILTGADPDAFCTLSEKCTPCPPVTRQQLVHLSLMKPWLDGTREWDAIVRLIDSKVNPVCTTGGLFLSPIISTNRLHILWFAIIMLNVMNTKGIFHRTVQLHRSPVVFSLGTNWKTLCGYIVFHTGGTPNLCLANWAKSSAEIFFFQFSYRPLAHLCLIAPCHRNFPDPALYTVAILLLHYFGFFAVLDFLLPLIAHRPWETTR